MDEEAKKKEVRQKYEDNDLFTLLSVHNLPVYVSMLVGLGITWGIFTARIDNISRQLDKIDAFQGAIITEQRDQDLLIERISTKLGMTQVEGVSTSSANLRR